MCDTLFKLIFELCENIHQMLLSDWMDCFFNPSPKIIQGMRFWCIHNTSDMTPQEKIQWLQIRWLRKPHKRSSSTNPSVWESVIWKLLHIQSIMTGCSISLKNGVTYRMYYLQFKNEEILKHCTRTFETPCNGIWRLCYCDLYFQFVSHIFHLGECYLTFKYQAELYINPQHII